MQTTVMVGEKPKVASRIAQALGNYSVEENRGVKNYVLEKDGKKIIIAPAVGHIFNLEEQEEGWDYPVFDVQWEPIFENEDGADYVKKYYNNLRDQLDKADEYVNACDFDLEGCLHPEEKVLVKNDEEIIRKETKGLVDELIDSGKTKESRGFDYVEPDLEILGMKDWETEFQKVEKVMRREADETFLEITSFNGRVVKVSKNHPLLVATDQGLESRRAEDLEEEDSILASKSIPSSEEKEKIDLIEFFDDIYIHDFKEKMDIMPAEMKEHVDKTRKQCLNYRHHDRMPKNIFLCLEEELGVEREGLTVSSYKGSTRLPAELPLNRKLGRILGLYLAEGCIDSGGFIGFYFGPEEDSLANEIQEFLKNTVNTEGKLRKREVDGSYGDSECIEVGTKSKILRQLLKQFEVGRESGAKKLPEWALSAPEEFKQGLISGYWDGDGSIFLDEKDDRTLASAGSKSRDLLDDIFYLLQTKGINPSFQAWTNSEREMTNLTVGRNAEVMALFENFLETREELQNSLETTVSTSRHDSLNRVPKCLAKRQGSVKAQKSNLKTQSTIANEHIGDWEVEMENYPKGDTTFLEVKEIEEKEAEADYFYDFQTENRNYQHGNGIISHNSVIGANVIKQLANADEERIKRMKFSTLTPDDLNEAFDNMGSFDKGMTEAGLTRHVLDFYYGVNVSRALMQAVRENDRYKTLSTGRVQGPSLKMLADKERSIMEFEPDPYWEIFLHHSEFRAKFQDPDSDQDKPDRIWEEEVADGIFDEVQGEKKAEVSNIKVNNYKHNPPIPFNLTGLQSEASSQFNINPKTTQSIAQELYEDGLISYPRTESQKLPKKLGYKNLLKKLKGQEEYEGLAQKVLDKDDIYPRQGKKEDDAHPAIYPTGESPGSLSKKERKVYDLIVKRFLAVFGDAAKRQSLTLTLDVKGYEFNAKSKVTKERNWFNLYDPYVNVEEAELPGVEEGEVLDVEEFELVDKETKPPRRYSQSSIVNELEKRELGTKATRAQIVDRLYDREYIESDPIEVTDLGLAIIETLEDHSPAVVSEELTREFEEKMEAIREEENSRKEVIAEAKDELTETLEQFKDKEKEIGRELVDTIDQERKRKRRLGPCDQCDDGTLRMIKSNGSRFVGCSNYPDCENSYPLPNNGDISKTEEVCEECNTPKIQVYREKSSNYTMCIDPDCPTKDDW